MDTKSLTREQLESKIQDFRQERDRMELEISRLRVELKNNDHRSLVNELEQKYEISKGILTELSLSLSRGIKEDFFRLITLAVWVTTAIFATVGIVATFGGYVSLKDLLKSRISEQIEKESGDVEKLLKAKFDIYETNVQESIRKIENSREKLIATEISAQQAMQKMQQTQQTMEDKVVSLVGKVNHSHEVITQEMLDFKKEGGQFKRELQDYAEQVKRYTDKMKESTFRTNQAIDYLAGFVVDPNPSALQKWEELQQTQQVVYVGSNVFDESRLLCAILVKLLERHKEEIGLNAIIPQYDYGGPTLQLMGLMRGKIDVYPSYTWSGFEMCLGTSLQLIAPQLQNLTPEEAIHELNLLCQKEGKGLQWMVPLGFQNNWEMVMLRQKATALGIQKISDLHKYQGKLALGGEFEFFHRAGYASLIAKTPYGYALEFSKIGTYLRENIYRELEFDDVDIVDGFTTDAQLKKLDKEGKPLFTRLEDDHKLLGKYFATFIVREKFLKQYPKAKLVLKSLENQITEEHIHEMLRKVEGFTQSPQKFTSIEAVEIVAEEFLKTFE